MQQALINQLAQLPGLAKVIARASTLRFMNSENTPEQIGEALGVRAVVTGSFLLEGDRLRMDVQLADTVSGRQVWGHTYERSFQDVHAVQNEVIGDIARAIELRLTPEDRERVATRSTIRPEIYEAYLRGMHELNNDRAGGIAYLQEAIDKDPGDPFAYAGLAKGYAAIGHGPAAPEDAWVRARAAERALTLAPDLADAHAVMGDVKLYYERDWAGAERAFQRANELNPNLAMNHYHYAWYLVLMDRLDEAIVEHERARDLDPLTPLHTAWLADLYRSANRYEDAIATAAKSVETNPDSAVGWQALGHVYSDLGRHDEAIAALERAVKIAPPWNFALGIAYARAGRTTEARQIIAKIQSRPATPYNTWARANLHGALGDSNEFFEWIAREPHHAWVPWVRTAKFLKSM
jgi:tetratricopeptide (TPR) repeat protein